MNTDNIGKVLIYEGENYILIVDHPTIRVYECEYHKSALVCTWDDEIIATISSDSIQNVGFLEVQEK